MIEIGCHYTGAVFLVQIRKLLTLVSIVGIIDIPISALNWTQKLRKKNLWSYGKILTIFIWTNFAKQDMDKWVFFWKWKLTSHLQPGWEQKHEWECWCLKKQRVSALFFITYLQVKGCQGHYKLRHALWINLWKWITQNMFTSFFDKVEVLAF